MIVCDFNMHVDVDVLSNSDSTKFRELLESFCLQQHVVGPTHIHGHTLDLIITRQSDQIVRCTPRVDCYFSDHAPVLCHLHSIKPSFSTRTLSYRKIKSVNVDSPNDDLAKSELSKYPPDDLKELVFLQQNPKSMPLGRLERLLCFRYFHGTQTKSDKLRVRDGKLNEDGGCQNLTPTRLSSKLSAMLSTVL